MAETWTTLELRCEMFQLVKKAARSSIPFLLYNSSEIKVYFCRIFFLILLISSGSWKTHFIYFFFFNWSRSGDDNSEISQSHCSKSFFQENKIVHDENDKQRFGEAEKRKRKKVFLNFLCPFSSFFLFFSPSSELTTSYLVLHNSALLLPANDKNLSKMKSSCLSNKFHLFSAAAVFSLEKLHLSAAADVHIYIDIFRWV